MLIKRNKNYGAIRKNGSPASITLHDIPGPVKTKKDYCRCGEFPLSEYPLSLHVKNQ
jgi:hypothetical protein